MVCKYEEFQGLLYTCFSIVWLTFTLWWAINTWHLNSINTKSIHKLIFFVLLLKTLYSGFYGCSKLFCETSDDEAYWGLAVSSTFTLYNTFAYTVISLMSRGFCLLRDSLNRVEVTSIAIIMGFTYLGFSAYLIQPENIAPFLLVIVGILFFTSIKCTVNNIKLLQERFFNLQEANIMPMLPELSIKISMLKVFLFFSYLFFVNEMVRIALICIGKTMKIESSNDFWVYETTVEQAVVTVSSFTIFFMYRSKTRNLEFNPSLILFQGYQHIAPIYTACLQNNDSGPCDRIALSVCPSAPLYSFEHLEDFPELFIAVPFAK